MIRHDDRLKSIEIRGFKSIPGKHPLRLHIGDVTILLGANGAGKSNIISFFRMLGSIMHGNLQQFIAETGSAETFLYYGSKTTPTLSADVNLETDGRPHTYSFKLGLDHGGLHFSSDNPGETVIKLLSSCKVYQFNDSSLATPMRQPGPVYSDNFLHNRANNLASFLYYIKQSSPASYKRITEYVKWVVPQFKDFYLEPEEGMISLRWLDTSDTGYVLSAEQLSDGSIRYMALATLLLQPRETMPFVIIIDEPELGLHPYAVDQLNEMIKDASKNAQIIVATQSPIIVDGFPADDITVIEYDEDNRGTCAKRLSSEEYKDWLQEYTVSELWNKNIIGGRPV